MEPDEFLSKDSFEALSEDEQIEYVERFSASLRSAFASSDTGRTLAFSEHYADIAKWGLPPDEYAELVELPAWNVMWENVDQFVATLEELASSPELSATDRRWASESLERARAMREHKRALEDL